MENRYNILGKRSYQINPNIVIHIPTLKELRSQIFIDNKSCNMEDFYYRIISTFTSTPCDLMIELEDMGINYTKITEYELFTILFQGMLMSCHESKKIPLGFELVFEKFHIESINPNYFVTQDNKIVFCDSNKNIIISEEVYLLIASVLRQIVFQKRNMEYYKVPLESTRQYILKRARFHREREREKKSREDSYLDKTILWLVNNCNFKYNFESVNDITIYDLMMSYKQINKNIEVDGLLNGYYTGNVDISKLSNNQLDRFSL